MHLFRWIAGAGVLIGLVVASGCEVFGISGCAGVGFSPVTAEVRDQFGRPMAPGAMMVWHSDNDSDTSRTGFPFDSLNLRVGRERAGVYSIVISRPFYQSVAIDRIDARGPSCSSHPVQVIVPVKLTLLPNAPPIRNVYVGTTTGSIGVPKDEAHFYPFVDANPGIPTAVRWSIDDTSQATISETGVVTAKCIRITDTILVTAVVLADTTVRATRPFLEVPRSTC